MAWRRADFKGNKIYAEVDAGGALAVESGRVAIRYSGRPGAKIYRAGASRVAVDEGAAVEQLPDGETPDESPTESKSKSKSSRKSGFGKAGTRSKQQAAMAADAAKKLIEGLDAGTAVCFTDGSCRGNPGPAGAGAFVQLPDGSVGEAAQCLGQGTNNIGELTAIGMALDLLDEQDVLHDTPIALFTDSSYAIGVLTKGWKAKANQVLIADVKSKIARWPGLQIHWVAGHVGTDGNERADALANAGVDGDSFTTWT